jgi:hypothetical protein
MNEIGPKIEYARNPRRRGPFGNWNACMDLCATEWLSILHDDDYLAPGFVRLASKLWNRLNKHVAEDGRNIAFRC